MKTKIIDASSELENDLIALKKKMSLDGGDFCVRLKFLSLFV